MKKVSEPPLHWAERVLGVPRGASPEALRTAILEQLRPGGQHLSAELAAALAILRGRAERPAELVRDVQILGPAEATLNREIAAFASAYFTLAPAERRRRFEALQERAMGYPWLAQRFERLGLALDVPFVKDRDKVDRLADYVCDLFVRPGPDRAARWRQALRELEHAPIAPVEVQRWVESYPHLARLEADFVRQVYALQESPAAPPTALPRHAPASYGRWDAQPQYQAQPQNQESGFPFWLVYVGIGILIAFIRAMSKVLYSGPRK